MTSGVGLDANRKAKMTRALSFPVSSSATLRKRAAAYLAAALVMVQPGVLAQAQPTPSSTNEDAQPVWPTDACNYWENQGVLLFFQPGSAVPLGEDRANVLLNHIAAGWREDRGFVLIEGHSSTLESPSQTAMVDRRRAEAVCDGLVARGIPARLIWVKPIGAAMPLVPGATTEADDRQNRRAVVFNTRRGEACQAQRRRLRLAWFGNHYMPVPPSASDVAAASCARALDEAEQGD